MEKSKNEISFYLDNISLFLLGALLLIFPIFVLTLTTDAFILPKQAILGAIVAISLLLFAVKIALERQVIIRRTPLDLPLVFFVIAVFLSAIFAVNRADAITSLVTLLLGVAAYFIIINVVKEKNSILLLATSLVSGAAIVSILSVLSFLKIYILPFAFTHAQTFSPLGSLSDQVLYLLLVLPISLYFAWPLIGSLIPSPSHPTVEQPVPTSYLGETQKKQDGQNKGNSVAFAIVSIIILIGLLLSSYKLFTSTPQAGGLIALPFETGFQTALASISQDTGRVLQGFLFGSGFGTYVTDFARYKQPAFNLNQNLWALTFFRSSSFVLELLATTGVLGLLTFLFLLFRIIKQKRVFMFFILAIAASFLVPFSFVIQSLFFILLALLIAMQGVEPGPNQGKLFDVELQLVALKKGLITFDTSPSKEKSSVLPSIFFVIIFITTGLIGYFGVRYLASDVIFQQSLVAASQNNGSLTYTKQANAISIFPYRDAYYRIFSQTNLALANSLAAAQPKGSTPNAQTQQTIFTLIQQSINSGRAATTYGPQTMLNWQNLSSIYRSLIGFGQNADSFAVLAAQQAIALDPNNPQEYINLGGIYFQLGQWDNAIRQFQIAATLKPDYANAYYNLGHALQEKGNLNDALSQYQLVKRLVVSDPTNLSKITKEIEDLQKRTGTGSPTASSGEQAASATNEAGQPLNISSPAAQLPPQNPPVKIPPPIEATKSSRR